MRREGKQHGVVKSFLVGSSRNKIPNKFDSHPVAGKFQKVPKKPTNHSKPTGFRHRLESRDGDASPVCKPHGKSKDTQKFKCSNVSTNQRLLAFKVAGKKERLNYSGISAREILDRLMGDALDIEENEEEYFEEDEQEDPHQFSSELHLDVDNNLVPYEDHSLQYANHEIDEGHETDDLHVGYAFYDEEQHQDLAQFSGELNSDIGNIVGSYLDETGEEKDEFEEDFDFLIWNVEAYSENGEDEDWCLVKEEDIV